MNHLEQQYLRAAYELAKRNPMFMFNEDEIANHLDLDPSEPGYADRVNSLTTYHLTRGFIQSVSKGHGMGSRSLKITKEGIEEVENSLSEVETQLGGTERPEHQVIELPTIDRTPDEFSTASPVGQAPVEIQDSLNRFRANRPDSSKVAFIMMQFGQTRAHMKITEAVRSGLAEYGIEGVRADGKRYHDYLFYNVLTYMHGCGLGMAIYERIETQTHNPNVALEVGYLFAIRKPVCLLKDQTLDPLPTDLVGQLYDPFDPQDPAGTIPPLVSKWLTDKGLV